MARMMKAEYEARQAETQTKQWKHQKFLLRVPLRVNANIFIYVKYNVISVAEKEKKKNVFTNVQTHNFSTS